MHKGTARFKLVFSLFEVCDNTEWRALPTAFPCGEYDLRGFCLHAVGVANLIGAVYRPDAFNPGRHMADHAPPWAVLCCPRMGRVFVRGVSANHDLMALSCRTHHIDSGRQGVEVHTSGGACRRGRYKTSGSVVDHCCSAGGEA